MILIKKQGGNLAQLKASKELDLKTKIKSKVLQH